MVVWVPRSKPSVWFAPCFESWVYGCYGAIVCVIAPCFGPVARERTEQICKQTQICSVAPNYGLTGQTSDHSSMGIGSLSRASRDNQRKFDQCQSSGWRTKPRFMGLL